jgi:hypothetical protein
VADECDAEQGLGVEQPDDQDRTVVLVAHSVELVVDIHADCAPPDFTRVVQGSLARLVHRFLLFALAVVLLHTYGALTRSRA